MANKGYTDSILGTLPDPIKQAVQSAFRYVLDNLRFGSVEHQTRATNFQAYWLTGTTAANAGEEFSIAHGLEKAPMVAFPVLPLNAINAQWVPLRVSRAADANRIYLTSSSTSAAFAVLVE